MGGHLSARTNDLVLLAVYFMLFIFAITCILGCVSAAALPENQKPWSLYCIVVFQGDMALPSPSSGPESAVFLHLQSSKRFSEDEIVTMMEKFKAKIKACPSHYHNSVGELHIIATTNNQP